MRKCIKKMDFLFIFLWLCINIEYIRMYISKMQEKKIVKYVHKARMSGGNIYDYESDTFEYH